MDPGDVPWYEKRHPASPLHCRACAHDFDPAAAEPEPRHKVTARDYATYCPLSYVRCPKCRAICEWRTCGCTGMQRKRLDARGEACPSASEAGKRAAAERKARMGP